MPKKNSLRAKNKIISWIMMIPCTVVLLGISVYPVFSSIYMSFTNEHLLRKETSFVGFDNYIRLMRDTEFWGSVGFTFIYSFAVVAVAYVAGMALALALNRDMKGKRFFRAVFLLPWVIPPVIAVTNLKWILHDQVGIINTTLRSWGVIDKPVLFLAQYGWIRPTVILASAWKQIPFMMITLLAGLQSVPLELYESAQVDGAGFWKQLFSITLPIIRPLTFINTTLSFIWTINSFEMIWLMTGGGPNGHTFTIPVLSYYTAFFRNDMSYAATIATSMLFVLLLLTLVNFQSQFRPKPSAKNKKGRGNHAEEGTAV